MRKITFLTLLCFGLLFTACGHKAVIPPVELIEIPAPIVTTTVPPAPPTEPEPLPETVGETAPPEIPPDEITPDIPETTSPTQTETASTTTTATVTTTTTSTDSETQTETTTEAKPQYTPWVKAYRSVLAKHCRKKQEEQTAETTEPLPTDETDSEDYDEYDYDYDDTSRKKVSKTEKLDNQWFVLIYLNEDTIPELVILDGTEMELYCFDGKTTQLLLEDSYKSDALDGQNVCYQPYSGYIASAFTTMGGGDGFTIYHFDELDSVHVQRYYFNNNENTEGEMAYNEIWDSAEEFEVIDNGYHDVTLGESWTHITAEMDGAYHLNFKDINKLDADSVPDIELNSESEQDPTEDEEEDE